LEERGDYNYSKDNENMSDGEDEDDE